MRCTLDSTLIVVFSPDGTEIEVDPMDGIGNLDDEASQSMLIGRAVRAALFSTEEDGAMVEVRIYSQ